jgi:hypothetical protein
MTRRGLALVLAVSVLGVVSAPAAFAGDLPPGGSFYDDDGNIHEGGIEAIAAEGITLGCNPPDNTIFCPDDPVTRGQMAAFLSRALDLPDAAIDFFTDDDGSTFENDINKMAEAKITLGCNPPSNTNYCPDGSVTRGQMAAFLVRAFGYTDNGEGDLFTDDDGSTFENDIDKLGTAGVTLGCNPPANDRYCPKSLVKRSQMATFLTRALGLVSMVPPIGFIGMFEGVDPPPDNSHVTLNIGRTGSDHRVAVELHDDGTTGCLNSFGEFSPASLSVTGTRIDPSRIEIINATVVCHLSGGDKVPPWSPVSGEWVYLPDHDVVMIDGVCHWRSDGGSVADCP